MVARPCLTRHPLPTHTETIPNLEVLVLSNNKLSNLQVRFADSVA